MTKEQIAEVLRVLENAKVALAKSKELFGEWVEAAKDRPEMADLSRRTRDFALTPSAKRRPKLRRVLDV